MSCRSAAPPIRFVGLPAALERRRSTPAAAMIRSSGVARPDDVLSLALQPVFETEGALQWLIT